MYRVLLLQKFIKACSSGWIFYQELWKCFKIYEDLVLWDVARDNCKSSAPNDSGDLASVTSAEIQEFITTFGKRFWIGGQSSDGGDLDSWSWSDGSDWSYNKLWAEKASSWSGPMNPLAVPDLAPEKWNGVAKGDKAKYLCQYFVKGECETGWSYFAEKCFKLYEESKTWEAARAVCQTDAPSDSTGDLASVTTNDMQMFMVTLIQARARLWIGGIKVAGQSVWEWSDGTPWGYDNWETGQQNNTDGTLALGRDETRLQRQ